MKFYVHHEAAPEYTLAVEWASTDTRTVAHLRADFAAAFSRITGSAAPPEQLQLSLAEDGPALPLEVCVAQVAFEGADMFAVRTSVATMPATAPPTAAAVATKAVADGEVTKKLSKLIKSAEKLWPQKQYRQARELYREYMDLQSSAGLKSGKEAALAMRRLGEIEVINGRPDKGLEWLERAEMLASSDVNVQLKLAEAHAAAGDLQEAVRAHQEALKCITVRPPSSVLANMRAAFRPKRAGVRLPALRLLCVCRLAWRRATTATRRSRHRRRRSNCGLAHACSVAASAALAARSSLSCYRIPAPLPR